MKTAKELQLIRACVWAYNSRSGILVTRLRIFLQQERTYEARKVHVLVCVSLERVQSRFGGAPKSNRRIESVVVRPRHYRGTIEYDHDRTRRGRL